MAGIVRGLLSLKCSADVIPGRFEVRKLIMENSADYIPRLQLFIESRFRYLLAESFLTLRMEKDLITVVLNALLHP